MGTTNTAIGSVKQSFCSLCSAFSTPRTKADVVRHSRSFLIGTRISQRPSPNAGGPKQTPRHPTPPHDARRGAPLRCRVHHDHPNPTVIRSSTFLYPFYMCFGSKFGFLTMSLIRLPVSLRTAAAKSAASQRTLHTTSSSRAGVLFALGALSNSRETAHFNKLSGLPRYEHSPPLKLVKTGEVDVYPCPTPSAPAPPSTAWASSRPGSASWVWDDKALRIGRVFLSNQARQSQRLRHAMALVKRRQAMQDALLKKERLLWQHERSRLKRDMRSAVLWILASIGTATALAAWRFFPEASARTGSADMGRKLAARAATAMPLPAAVVSEPTAVPLALSATMTTEKGATNPELTPIADKSHRSWFNGAFWKQSAA